MKKMNKVLLVSFCFCLLSTAVYANKIQGEIKEQEREQQVATRVVTGKIIDEFGEGLPGVSVFVPGTNLGTTTDIDGNFSLEVPSNTKMIEVSYIGMTTEQVMLGDASNYDLAMKSDAVALDEVVAIGYGSSKKSDITSAISTVSGVEQIDSRAITSAQDFLQGNVAGVTVLQQGGDPTRTPDVVIRGVGSINNESPLWVIDGVPYDKPQFINPNDIKSISILKDAASAAIYGAQASTGVVVVTTKSGVSGKPKVSFNFILGGQRAANLPTPLNAKEQNLAYKMAAENSKKELNAAYDATKNPWGATTRTNWIDAIFRSARLLNTNVSVAGGSDRGQYMTSFSYQDREGLLVGTNAKRYTFRVKSSYDLTDKITVGENFTMSYQKAVGVNTSSSYSGAIINAIYMPSAAPVYEADGKTFHGVAPIGSKFAGAYGDIYNPVALLLRPTTNAPTTNYNGSAYITYKPIEGLTLKSTFSMDLLEDNYKKFTPKIPESGRRTEMNYLDQNWSNRKKWIWDNQVSYEKYFGEHKLEGTLVYSSQKTDYEYNVVHAQDFSKENEWYQYIRNAKEVKEWDSDVYEDALTSAIGRLRYNYANRYFFSASLRQDKTSRLHKDNNTDYFPAVSAGWKISAEPFMENFRALSNLKLRASWGEIGNIRSVGYYSYDVPMSSNKPYLGKSPQYVPGFYVSQESNPNLKWEVSETYDIGLDASFLRNKIEIVADYYEKYTRGMILPRTADPHKGYNEGYFDNVGDVKNTGFEFSVLYRNQDNAFKYTIAANLATVKNELLKLNDYESDYIPHRENVRSILSPFRSQVGKPLYSYYLIPCEGTFKSQAEIDAYKKDGKLIQPDAKPGDLKFTDVDGNGEISDADRTFHGNAFPDFTYGINLTGEYKGFDMALGFQGVSGAKIFNGYKYTAYNMAQQGYNRDNRVLDSWSDKNTNSNIPRLTLEDKNHNFGTNSTWYLENASYLRLKNLTIGYTVPSHLLKSFAKDARLRIYFSAENLFTITDYSGMDPEVGGVGLDVGAYPVARTLSGGISLTF